MLLVPKNEIDFQQNKNYLKNILKPSENQHFYFLKLLWLWQFFCPKCLIIFVIFLKFILDLYWMIFILTISFTNFVKNPIFFPKLQNLITWKFRVCCDVQLVVSLKLKLFQIFLSHCVCRRYGNKNRKQI